METTYRVWTNSGTSYAGTDEDAANAAYDRWVEYIDSDTSHQPLMVTFEQDGRLVTSHKSHNYDAYWGKTW
jgi:hypothetical protein